MLCSGTCVSDVRDCILTKDLDGSQILADKKDGGKSELVMKKNEPKNRGVIILKELKNKVDTKNYKKGYIPERRLLCVERGVESLKQTNLS